LDKVASAGVVDQSYIVQVDNYADDYDDNHAGRGHRNGGGTAPAQRISSVAWMAYKVNPCREKRNHRDAQQYKPSYTTHAFLSGL
jgi:hypothetical protein